MASIRKLPSGSWNVQIRHKGSPSVSKTFPSKKEATAFIRQFNSELTAQGKPLQPLFSSSPTHPLAEAKTTLREALHRYHKEVTVNKRGHREERYRIKNVDSILGHLLMVEIEPHHIAKYRDHRLASVTNDTVNRELALLSHLFNIARIDWGWSSFIKNNPVSLVRKPKPNRSRDFKIAEEELELILQAIPEGHPVYTIVQLAYHTAMRRGEIMNMVWSEIDWTNRVIYLPITKNGESRYCPLSSLAFKVLTKWAEHCKITQSIKGSNNKVFNVHPDTVSHMFSEACEASGLKGFRFHDLRHTATTNLIKRGLSIMEASQITGHKSFEMLKRYTHLAAVDLVEKLG
jgi:integrase